ncbi:hypothetical protein DB346_17205 [Verrucomicrobia bacterium LW23]|nr:hypothetical protein DB346_17205 [Verrucomicrobia bacterium LW23]
METKSRELIVGFFLIFGMVLVAGLVLVFGKLQDEFSDDYTLYVTFPNANGLLKGSNVNFAGAAIGRVVTSPEFIDEGRAVRVKLRIRRNARIREDAKFTIGSSGLLGDRFVEVTPLSATAKFLDDEQTVQGERVPGMDDMMKRTEPLIDNATAIAMEARKTLNKLNQDVLTPDTVTDLRGMASRANNVLAKAENAVSSADKALRELKDKIDPLVNNMNTFVVDAKGAIGEIKKTLDKVNTEVLTPEVVADLREAIAETKVLIVKSQETMENTNRTVLSTNETVKKVGGLVDGLRYGKGGVARLINDPEVADNLAVFIAQLRKRGVLWYSDQKVKKPLQNAAQDSPAASYSKPGAPGTPPAPATGRGKSSATDSRRTNTTR